MALTKYINVLSAVRTFQIAHIFYNTKYRHIHLLCHIYCLGYDHSYQFLRRGNDNDTIYRK